MPPSSVRFIPNAMVKAANLVNKGVLMATLLAVLGRPILVTW